MRTGGLEMLSHGEGGSRGVFDKQGIVGKMRRWQIRSILSPLTAAGELWVNWQICKKKHVVFKHAELKKKKNVVLFSAILYSFFVQEETRNLRRQLYDKRPVVENKLLRWSWWSLCLIVVIMVVAYVIVVVIMVVIVVIMVIIVVRNANQSVWAKPMYFLLSICQTLRTAFGVLQPLLFSSGRQFLASEPTASDTSDSDSKQTHLTSLENIIRI